MSKYEESRDFIYREIDCFVVRHLTLGHWCGYVRLPDSLKTNTSVFQDLRVHGGISFDGGKPLGKTTGIWIGFDCAHAGDVVPGVSSHSVVFEGETFKDLTFVENECRQLVDQLLDGFNAQITHVVEKQLKLNLQTGQLDEVKK